MLHQVLNLVYASYLSQRIGPVAITIRNKQTEEMIRTIGRRTGEGPSAIVSRLAKAEINGQTAVPPDVVRRRISRMRELRAEYKRPDDPKLSWAETEREMDAIFGEAHDHVEKN